MKVCHLKQSQVSSLIVGLYVKTINFNRIRGASVRLVSNR